MCMFTLGLIVQPIVGAISDTSTFRMGRRRPFILMGGVLVLASLVCISYSKELATLSGPSDPDSVRGRKTYHGDNVLNAHVS
jgi:solute carrier family 45 protein 1/2/4